MLTTALLALTLTAAPPASRAEALAAKNDAETLFLEFGAVKPDDYPEPERKKVAKALLKGAESSRKDPMIAVGLAEKAVALDKTPQGLALLGAIEVDLNQRGAAAEHLEQAIALKPDFVQALMDRAELAMKEDDFAVAADLYEKAQKAGAKNAKPLLAKARQAADAKTKAVEDLKTTEQNIKVRVADAARNATRDWLRQIIADDHEASEKRRLAPDGVRQQEMANFVFTYSTGSKKTGDMFAFENKVEKLLEKTYDFVSDKLAYKRPTKTPVILMTREEFAAKHAGTPQERAAGYWNGKEIVINGGADVNENFAQVMVHEFTHAVVTDLAGHGAPIWMNEGLAENMRLHAMGLKGKVEEGARMQLSLLKKQGQLPSLGQLQPIFAGMGPEVGVAYALAAFAADLLVDKRGHNEYVDTLREMKRGRPDQILAKHYKALAEIDKEVQDAL